MKTPTKGAGIGLGSGKILDRYKAGKHFKLQIADGLFQWQRRQENIEQESQLDGIYIVRTSESYQHLTAENTVRGYKSLSTTERMFRTLKGVDLLVRPIRHRTDEQVPAHIFICMLACYVQWHMRQPLAPILFQDDQLPEIRKRRNPVLPAELSDGSSPAIAGGDPSDALLTELSNLR